MFENHKVIPDEYMLKWLDVVLLVAKLGLKGFHLINCEVRKELFTVYYDGMEINRNEGFIVNEIRVVNKPNLYTYLNNNKPEILVRKPNLEKNIKKKYLKR